MKKTDNLNTGTQNEKIFRPTPLTYTQLHQLDSNRAEMVKKQLDNDPHLIDVIDEVIFNTFKPALKLA